MKYKDYTDKPYYMVILMMMIVMTMVMAMVVMAQPVLENAHSGPSLGTHGPHCKAKALVSELFSDNINMMCNQVFVAHSSARTIHQQYYCDLNISHYQILISQSS